MADSLPSPPESRQSTPDSTANDLTEQLDSLLEQYLDLLDQYTKLRENLSKTFSAGFFSLAQAQRTSNLGAGRRYGEEYYDERMKAQRRIIWQSDAELEGLECRVEKVQKKDSKSKDDKSKRASIIAKGSRGHDTKDESKEQQEIVDQSETSATPVKKAKAKQDPATRDPLTWFGILVPPALRQTQTLFVKATEDQIPALLAVSSKMKATEQRIWKMREELGILSDYDLHETETEVEPVEAIPVKEETKIAESKREDSRTSRKTLTSRPAHSKSHLLKLGD